jgi:hypothetical protein
LRIPNRNNLGSESLPHIRKDITAFNYLQSSFRGAELPTAQGK